jgi:hypothetical protein
MKDVSYLVLSAGGLGRKEEEKPSTAKTRDMKGGCG